jgi:hypothetical protein
LGGLGLPQPLATSPGDANYNLSFPGADALLGTLLQPNLRDLFQMRAQGVLHY